MEPFIFKLYTQPDYDLIESKHVADFLISKCIVEFNGHVLVLLQL
jgi:hypothetical protein